MEKASASHREAKSADCLRVLVIDDEPRHAEAVAESLERVGYECVVATSGQAGARKIARSMERRGALEGLRVLDLTDETGRLTLKVRAATAR